jgi:uncharacterized protein YjbI with pentapeptide repeats
MGAGAQLANSEELAIIQQGAKAWNQWRDKNKERAAFNLSGTDLHGRDLTGANLRGVDLSNADLYQTNFRGADLQDVNFASANLFHADLRESNLQGADLSTAKGGLLSRQLAGSVLTGAKLPEPLAKLYADLSSAKEISSNAQKLFLALLAGCLYSWLTIAQTTDVELITNRATTPLPIIQAAIPIVGFYVVAPLILLCMYFYFHFYLQKLWEELGSLPAVFTDGRELHKRTDPWLLNDLVRSHFVKLKDDRPFLSYFQSWASIPLAWWLVPITLFAFWLQYIRRHDLFGTIVHALLLTLSIFSAVRLYKVASRTLRGAECTVFRWKNLRQKANYWRLGSVTGLGALLVVISLGAIFGRPCPRDQCKGFEPQIKSPSTWIPWVLTRAGSHTFVILINADLSIKPGNWDDQEEKVGSVKGADLTGRDLRYAYAFHAFFAKALMVRASLQHINFFGCDLREAHLEYSYLTDADLSNSSLKDALLISADLRNATLRFVSLKNAALNSADLTGANLEGADLKYADFQSFPGMKNTRGLTQKMIVRAKDWQLAFYDPDMLEQLGLPPDHNEKLQKQMEAEQQQAKSATTTSATPK